MNSTWIALAQGYEGVIGFAIFFLAPGFLLASAVDFNAFSKRSRAEKLLWSICLSLPLTIQICVTGGRLFSFRVIVALLLFLAVAALALLRVRNKGARVKVKSSRATYTVILLASLLGLYLVFAVTDVQIGPHLYVSTVLYDWSVRVPMVNAAMHSGVPPVNGLSALSGQPAPLRYFYFWYVVCADAARLLHVPGRAALAASCVWAAWALLSVFLLSLKYLLQVRRGLRLCCVLAFPTLAVMGLDLLPTLALLFVKKLHPYAEIEWWHQDRTPSFLSSAMYAPHHVAAFACLLTGLLAISRTLQERSLGQERNTMRQVAFASIFAGICFASAAGCSILPTVIATIVCTVWGVDLIRQKQVRTVAALCGSAVIALILAYGFLHELQVTGGAVSNSFVSLRWRNYDFVRGYQQKYRLISHSLIVNQSVAQLGVLAINFFDLGFFLLVFIDRVRRDRARKLTGSERAMWAFFLGTAIPYFFLSSASIASPNDLGVDAGLLLRLLLQMWAVPLAYETWQGRRQGESAGTTPRRHRLGFALAVGCLVIGLAGEAFQVVWERIYFPLVGSQMLAKQIDILTTDHLAERLFNIRQGYRALDRSADPAPATAAVQYNPISPMQPAMTFYSTHQIGAFDPGCGTGYGGDYAACLVVMPRLLALYGNTQGGIDRAQAGNVRQDGAAAVATAEDAVAMCRELHLAALMAESLDSVWYKPDSWVWTMKPVVANETIRVFRCPAS